MESTTAGVTMNCAPAAATSATSCRVRTVPAPIATPSGTWAATCSMASRAPGVVSATSTNRMPASARAITLSTTALVCVPRMIATTRAAATSSTNDIVVHHSANEPSAWRQIGPRQAWPRLSAARTACSSISMPRPGPVRRSMCPSTNCSGAVSMT